MKYDIINPFLNGEGALISNTNPPGIGARAFATKAIEGSWMKIVALTGKIYITSAEMLDSLHSLGVSYSSNGQKLKKPNAIGDILGKHGLHLPVKMIDGKKHFFLGAIRMNTEERKAFDELSDAGKAARVTSIIAEVEAILFVAELAADEEPLQERVDPGDTGDRTAYLVEEEEEPVEGWDQDGRQEDKE